MMRARSRRFTVVCGAGAAALVVAGAVGAFWAVGSEPGGNGHASVGSLPAAAIPTSSLAGRNATLSWAQSTVLGSPLGQLAGGGYAIARYAESDPSTSISAGGSCSGSVSGGSDPLSCTELSLPTGRWRYAATPLLYSWVGVEGPQSTSLVIPPSRPTSLTFTNGGGNGNAFINATNDASLTFAVVLPTTSLAGDTVTLALTDGTTTVTATADGIDGGGTRTFSGIDASGLADGSIAVSTWATSEYGDSSSLRSIVRTKDTVTPTLTALTMQDANTNGKVDRTLATFSEALAAYSAGTAPWTLADVPSGGALASVSVSGTSATLTIGEGAGAPDTAVDSFTLALATSATGIRDAAGNLASFAATTPADGAKPVLVAGTLAMRDVDDNGKVDRVAATFSETLAASSDTAPWTLASVPSGGTLASVSTAGAGVTLTIAEGAGAQNTAVGSFRVTLAASASGIRDAAGNLSSFGSSAPLDQATPVLVSATMQDANTNGKVDRTLATFSEALAAYSAGTAPWTLADVPSGGSLASVSVSGVTATLTIGEGAGAPDTAVDSFTVALATSASGIRDAAGNLASFAASSPADGAKPVPVGVTSTNNGVTAGLMEVGDTFEVTFSEAIATPVGPGAAITETDPGGPGNDRLTIAGLTAGAGVVTGSDLYVATNNTSAAFSSSTMSTAGAVITATVAGSCSGTCGANITAGSGALVFTPDPALQDAAGNSVAGSFTTPATFRLF